MPKTLVRLLLIGLFLTLPFAVAWIYGTVTALPEHIVIATGPQGGRYQAIAKSLASHIEEQLGVRVTLNEETEGSHDNLKLLREQRADFVLYQPGTEAILGPAPETKSPGNSKLPGKPKFVANVYSEVAHWIVRRDSGIKTPADLVGRSVAVGQAHSGDYAMSRVLLEHFGINEQQLRGEHLDYAHILERMKAETLDAAFVTVGVEAEILRNLAESEKCELRSLPYSEALIHRHVLLSPYTIPAGMYNPPPNPFPETGIQTAALRAQLLTREGVDNALVEEVVRILLSESFLRGNQLEELFAGGKEFAAAKSEFALHPGAVAFYDPELKPLLPSDFVEGMEGLRSFIVSVLLAGFLLFRWSRNAAARRKAHWLDQCITSLLDIERRQLHLDQKAGSGDLDRLQKLLDEVTDLRQNALRKVSAHDLSEDRAADCFLEMCHALSDKINAKITRQRLERGFEELTKKLAPD